MTHSSVAQPAGPETVSRPKTSLRDFWLVLSGQAVSMQGDGLSSLALLWWIAQDTGSVGVATTLTMVTMLPVIILGPAAGVVIDRYSRRVVMMITDLVRAASAAFLAWGIMTGQLQLWMLLTAATISAACRAFHRPALQASLPQLVPASYLTRANSFYQMAEAGANMIAPPLGGALVAWIGTGAVVGISAVTCIIAALTLFLAVIPQVSAAAAATSQAGSRVRRFFQEMAAGVSYLWSGQRMLFFMLCTFALVNFALSPIGPLLPFVAEQRLGLQAAGFGLLLSSNTVGTMVGSMLVSVIGSRLRRGLGVIWGLVGIGLALIVLGQVTSAALAVAAFVLMGFSLSICIVCSNTLFQTRVPHDMQGRVFAVRTSISQAAGPIGLAIVGAVSAAVAPHTILLVSGAIVVVGGLIGYAVPGLAAAE